MEELMSDIVQAAGSTPPLRDFLVSPGFAGLALVIAAVALFFAVLYSSRRAEKRLDRQLDQSDIHQQERRADRDRDAAIKRGWERLQWLIDTATNEPAGIANGEVVTLGLGPELTLTILSGLQREATELGD